MNLSLEFVLYRSVFGVKDGKVTADETLYLKPTNMDTINEETLKMTDINLSDID